MIAQAVSSEALLVRRRPAPYVIGAAWTLLVVVFAFAVPYIVYLSLDASEPGRDNLLEVVLPASVHTTALSSFPLFGGAIFLILGVVLMGAEARWGTWKVRFTQGPSRATVVWAKFALAAVAGAVIACVAFAAAAGFSLLLAVVVGEPTALPGPAPVLRSLLAAALLAVVWISVGMALAVICKGTSVALAVGLMWTLALENAIGGLAAMLPAIEPVRHVLLSSASGSLVAATGAPTQGDGGTPGVVDVLSGPWAVAVLAGYLAASVAAAIWLLRRRDVA